jgi:CYTH domain-containing protein
MQGITHLETEKKYLISMPDTAALLSVPGAYKEDIEQTYLFEKEGRSRRLRKTVRNGAITYIYNEKETITSATRLETERYLDADEYERLKNEADPIRNVIFKTRYTVPDLGFVYEIDIYSFSRNRAILEIELENENLCPPIPFYLHVLREVTKEKAFSNRAIAKEIPYELTV